MAARWTFAVAARYAAAMDTRLQLVLFVDNPVDALVVSHVELAAGQEALDDGLGGLPWGRIPLITTPAWDGARYRRIAVSARDFRPGATDEATTP